MVKLVVSDVMSVLGTDDAVVEDPTIVLTVVVLVVASVVLVVVSFVLLARTKNRDDDE